MYGSTNREGNCHNNLLWEHHCCSGAHRPPMPLGPKQMPRPRLFRQTGQPHLLTAAALPAEDQNQDDF